MESMQAACSSSFYILTVLSKYEVDLENVCLICSEPEQVAKLRLLCCPLTACLSAAFVCSFSPCFLLPCTPFYTAFTSLTPPPPSLQQHLTFQIGIYFNCDSKAAAAKIYLMLQQVCAKGRKEGRSQLLGLLLVRGSVSSPSLNAQSPIPNVISGHIHLRPAMGALLCACWRAGRQHGKKLLQIFGQHVAGRR